MGRPGSNSDTKSIKGSIGSHSSSAHPSSPYQAKEKEAEMENRS